MYREAILGLAVGLCALTWAPTVASAQVTGGGAVTGVVKDQSGAVLPGVGVEASSPALIERVRNTVTDEHGQFTIVELRPGTYTVTFTLAGFSTLKREGIELTPNFTATINADLKLGELEETVMVSGAAPLVDARNVTQQKTIGNEVLSAVPTAKSVLSFAALMPAVVTPPNAQDVGGTKGETSVRLVVHGSKPNDQRLLQDGLRYNGLASDGTGRGYYVNPLASSEIVVDIGAIGSSEYATSGAYVNMISRDGANNFRGTLFGGWTGHQLQGDNFTDELRAEGLKSVNGIRKIYDGNAVIGGPLMQDRLWFMTSFRQWGRTSRVANLFADSGADYWQFTPDFSQPVEPQEYNKAFTLRGTWQPTTKDKFTASYNIQRNVQDQAAGQLDKGNLATEANGSYCQMDNFLTTTWTHPSTNRLLFEGGVGYNRFGFGNNMSSIDDLQRNAFDHCGQDLPDRVLINDTGKAFTYHGGSQRNKQQSDQVNGRFSMSYVTGTHNFKTGVQMMADTQNLQYASRAPTDANGMPLTYTFLNGKPSGLTEYVSPLLQSQHLRPDLGIFVQDQWNMRRLTLNLGVRYDYIRASAPAITRAAGPLNDAADFPAVDCVPCWHDIDPRAALVFDPKGDGKTAIKVGIGRYVLATTVTQATMFSPQASTVNSTTRSWTDTNGNFYPDCNLRDPALNGECGPMANPAFGQLQIRTTPDPDWIRGWGKRGYDWQTSVTVDSEVMPGVMMSAGYFRTWFGNFTVTRNLSLNPATDYDPYCITAPVDSRLPGGGGNQICGLYDLKPDKFGITPNNVVTLANNFGNQTEVFNGVDLNFAVRAKKLNVNGGFSVGDSIQTTVVQGGAASSRTNACFVVNSPQDLYHCDVRPPYLKRFKVSGLYSLPRDVQVAAVYQNLPTIDYQASYTVTSAQVAQSLGRPLSGGVRSVTIDLLDPFSSFIGGRLTQLDLRGSKIFRFGKSKFQANIDLYNVFNASTVVGANNAYTSSALWLQPTQILDARMAKLSVQLDF